MLFRSGGEGRAFHETTSGNLGGSTIRNQPSEIDGVAVNDGVDVASGASSAYLSHAETGEWFEYTVNVTAGTYQIAVNAASVDGGEFQLALNGTTIATCAVPAGGTFTYINLPNVALAQATNAILRLTVTSGSVQVDRIATLPALLARAPFAGVPTLPGTIEAEACDIGPGAFSEATSANTGDSSFRNRSTVPGWIVADAVDVSAGGTGTVLSDAQSGEWFEYTVRPLVTGRYDLTLNAASATGGSVQISLGGTALGTFAVPVGGFGDIALNNVAIARGEAKLRLTIVSGVVSIDRLSAVFGSSPAEIIIDNSDSECLVTGAWQATAPAAGSPTTHVGTNYLFVDAGTSAQAAYSPYLPRAGSYLVSVRYQPNGTRGVATYTTAHANGTTTQRIDQKTPGTAWVWLPLGTFPCAAGNGVTVTIDSTTAAARIMADAIRFQEVTATSEPLTIDNSDVSRVEVSGNWLTAISVGNYLGENYFTITGGTPASVTYRPTITQAGFYQVQERHPSSGWTAVNAVITSVNQTTGASQSTNVTINQNTNAGTWINVGSPVLMNVGSGSSVAITNAGLSTTTSARADGIRFVFTAPVPNRAPVANADPAITVAEDAVFTGGALLANDTDVDGNALTAELFSGAANGSVTVEPNGSFSYTPSANFHGSDSFSYRAKDASAYSNPVTVSITVTPVDDPAVAVADAFATDEDTTLTVAAPGLLANDSNIDAKPISLGGILAQPTKGTLTWAADGSFTYVPNANANGDDSFSYQIFDGTAAGNSTTVTLTLTALDDAPVAQADSYWTRLEQTLTVNAAQGVLANDSDVESEPLAASVVTEPAHGVLSLAADGSFTYAPELGYIGTDSFTYRVTAGALTADQTVALLVKPPAIAPVIDTGIAGADPITGTTAALSVVASDPDADPAPLTYTWSATGPATVTFSPNGSTGAAATVATFAQAGVYELSVAVSDGESTTTDVRTVTVAQTPTTLAVAPTSISIANGRTKRLTPSGTDQFGAALAPLPTVTWSVVAGDVTVAANGDVTAPATGTGSATVRATLDALTADAAISVIVPGTGLNISRDDGTGAESTSDTARFKITRAASAATPLPVLVTWSGTATNGSDYNTLGGVVTIPANSTQVLVTVTPRNDSLVEGRETVVGTITTDVNYAISKASDSVEILDDQAPRIAISATDNKGAENGSDGITFRLTRYPVNASISVPVTPVMSGSATNDSDYSLPAPTVSISGSAASVDIVLNRIDDAETEGTETITMTVPASANYSLDTTTSATATLGDDEKPQVTMALTDLTAAEPGTDTGRLTLTRWPVSSATLDVGYAVTGNTGRILPLPEGARGSNAAKTPATFI